MTVRKNAVERRLDLLHDQWMEFAQLPEARLLRWLVEPDEVRMVEAFLEKEGDERMGECPDLFLRLDEPFDEPARYGYALREALVRMEEESRAGLEEEGLSGWRCPPVKEGETDVEAFLAACDSLRSHYEGLGITAVLKPGGEFVTLLESGVGRATPGAMQFVSSAVPGTLPW